MFEPSVIKAVVIDRLKCQGTGYCVKIAPGLFRLDGGAPAEVNHGRLQETDPDLVTEAEDTCPTRAILVVR
jgi:ferredoxin